KDDPQPQPDDTTDSVIISPAVYDAIAKAKAREKKRAEEPKPEIVREEIAPETIEPKKPEPKSEPKPEPPKEQAKEKSFEELISENAKRDLAEANHEYRFPPIELLEAPRGGSGGDGAGELDATRNRLELILQSFGINAHISNIINGPSVTRYEMELEIGVKLNKLTSLADDIALALGVGGVRIAAIPNKISTVGIEVPNKHTSTVYLREIISSPTFQNAKSKLTFALGKNIGGEVMVGNINKLPHLLIAGTTGSGKSVSLNSLILSLMYKATPDEVKFIMIDPKMVEFKIYNGIPHLLVPVVTEAKKAAGALQWAVTEMMKRYRLFSEVGARDIAGYNEHLKAQGESPIPFVVVIIDELADLMLVAAKEVEESICRVAQMGRAAGVHLVIATQSPRADVITGLMKANIPSRISFKVASSLESRIILDAGGAADKLMGNGDMLYAPIGTSKPVRIQGSWVSDEEREKIVDFVKQSCTAEYSEDVIYEIEKAAEDKSSGGKPSAQEEPKGKEYDELLPQAVDVIFETQQASVSMLQRRLKLGYARAARLVDQMEEIGVVGPFEGSKPRQILVTRQQWSEMQFLNGTAPLEKPADNDTMTSADDLFDDNTGEEEDL
ncbi:MAG: DNA translocase FtsK, partial [Oscillospiraceae bacterium]|nr:DNA translocase FtsK [Oscillospiraceae bacterium]